MSQVYAACRTLGRLTLSACTLAILVLLPFYLTYALEPEKGSASRVVVVFFSGLCNSPDACRASQQAQSAIAPKLPPGATLITPKLTAGAFPDQASAKALASSLADHKIILIAYSAGNKAFSQTVSAMTPEQLKHVRTIVSLEAEYSGFDVGVRRVRSVNPQVEVHRFTRDQFKTNHSLLPSAPGVGDAIRTYSTEALGDRSAGVHQSILQQARPSGAPLTPIAMGRQTTQLPTPYSSLFSQPIQTGSTPSIPSPSTLTGPPQSLRQIMSGEQSGQSALGSGSAVPAPPYAYEPMRAIAPNTTAGLSAIPTTQPTEPPTLPAAPPLYSSPQPIPQNTFTSADISDTSNRPNYAPNDTATEHDDSALSRLREVLRKVGTFLNALRQ